MGIIQGKSNFPDTVEKSSVGIGVFDGVHWGHRAIFRQVLESAAEHDLTAVALTFDRHPARVLAPSRAPKCICSLEQRVELILQTGIEHVVIAHFDEKLASIPREEFVSRVLKHNLRANVVAVGANFRFGKNREGDIRYLNAVRDRFKIQTQVVSSVIIDGSPVSSTRIRKMLAQGDVNAAANLLGHEFILRGEVVSGRKMGRELGYPTANVRTHPNQVLPKLGVYAVRAKVDRAEHIGICSVGKNPTFGEMDVTVEVHLLNFDQDIYGKIIDVAFLERIRGEIKFDGPEQLVRQIDQDIRVMEGLNGTRKI